jgi:MFS family permease
MLARTTSMLGNAVAPLALAFAVLDLTGSASALGVVVGVRSVSNVAFLLLGGVLADRIPRQRLLVWSSLAAGATQATVAALVLSGTASIPLLLALGVLNGAASGLAYPASAAVTPQTVPATVRQQANALLRMSTNSALIVGAAAGGGLVAVVGPGWGLAIDAGSFLVAGALFATVRIAPGTTPKPEARSSVLAELRDGWGEFTARTWVWVTVAAFMVTNAAFAGGQQILGPLIADRTFGRGGWGLVLAAETAGMLAGGVVALRWMPRRPILTGMLWVLPTVPILLGLALAPYVLPLMAIGFFSGIGVEQFSVAWDTALQEHIPPERLARVYSYDMLGSLLAVPVGEIAVGPIAAHVGTRATLLGAAAVALVAVAAAVATPSVRKLRRRVESAAPAPVG